MMNMPMPWMELAAVMMISATATIAGFFVATRWAPHRKIFAAIGFGLVAWPLLCNIAPDRFYFAYPSFWGGHVLFGTAFFLSGVLARAYADTSLRRILQGVLAILALYFVMAVPLWFAFNAGTVRALDGPTRAGVTMQSEFYTCMPSALATVLRLWGVEAREGDIAYHMRSSFQGTSANRVPAAARKFGSAMALDADILNTDLDELERLDRPAILLGYTGSVRHAVALMALDEYRVVIGDPLHGRVEVPREEFPGRFRWTGLAIVTETTTAGEGPRFAAGPSLKRSGE